MDNVINLALYRKKRKSAHFPKNRKIYVLASLEHLLMGTQQRGYTLLIDKHNTNFYSIRNSKKQLIGSCEFTDSGRFVSYSIISKEGKYVSKNVSNQSLNSIGLTTQFLEELAAF